METVPSITALKFQGGLTMAVGTVTGQILLYDIRSNKPFLIKDQKNSLPIRNIEFHEQMDLVYSMDSSVVKIWEKQTVRSLKYKLKIKIICEKKIKLYFLFAGKFVYLNSSNCRFK